MLVGKWWLCCWLCSPLYNSGLAAVFEGVVAPSRCVCVIFHDGGRHSDRRGTQPKKERRQFVSEKKAITKGCSWVRAYPQCHPVAFESASVAS